MARKIRFEKDNSITVFINKQEYNFFKELSIQEDIIEECGKNCFNCLIKTFATIEAFKRMTYNSILFVPIHDSIFTKTTGLYHKKYREALKKRNIIEVKQPKVKEYFDEKDNKKKYKTSGPMMYCNRLMNYQFSNNIFDTVGKDTVKIQLKFDTEGFEAMKKRDEIVSKYINSLNQKNIEDIFNVNAEEVIKVNTICRFVSDCIKKKIKSDKVINRRFREILSNNISDSNNIDTILDGIIKLLNIINYNDCNFDKKREVINMTVLHIAKIYSAQSIDIQSIKPQKQSTNSIFSYYSDLQLDSEVLNLCYSFRDLKTLANITNVPEYHKGDNKLYSNVARIKKVFRGYIRFNNSPLVEVSDITAAHFTMLPMVLKHSGISIPENELLKYIKLTQTGDIYTECTKGTNLTRSEIKAQFQPFFSIKNEKQFLYADVDDRDLYIRQTIVNFFKTEYPSIYQAMLDFHISHPKQTIKSVANIVESDIMNPICDTLRSAGLHPFRVHDAIYLPDSEKSNLHIDINSEVFKTINSYIGIIP